MSGVITSQLIYDRYTGVPGGGVTYLKPGVGQISYAVTELYFAWNMDEVRLRFDASDDSFTMLNDADGRTFWDREFQNGDNITIVDTVSNNGNWTIDTISEDGRTVYVTGSLTNETINSCTVHGVTPIGTIDYFFNCIENSETPTYLSKVDSETEQRYTALDVDATEVIHETNFRVLTASRAWVTNEITNADTGETSEVKIIGGGVVNYRQYFTIEHLFKVSPIYTTDLYGNFTDNIAPDYYRGGKSLKYISKIEARFLPGDPEAQHSVEQSTIKGTGAWIDQAAMGRKPEYYVDSVAYSIGGQTAEEIDVNKTVVVTVTYKSVTGEFKNSGTKTTLYFNVCPSDPSDYQDNDRTQIENLFWDSYTAIEGAAAGDGDLKGTGYGCINDCVFTYVDDFTMTAVFTFTAEANLIEYWESKEDLDRWYLISLVTSTADFLTTATNDAVTIKADFNTAEWDKTDATLFEFTGSGLYWYPYPDNGTYGVGDANLLEGDVGFWAIPFRVFNDPDADGNTPTVKEIKVQVLAAKTGSDDFVLEEKIIECDGFRKLDDVQQLDVNETRGFISYEDDPRNGVTVVRDDAEDTATMAAYLLSYGMTARYEDWISAYDSRSVNAEGINAFPDVAKEIENVTQRWANYSGVNGWALKFRFTIVITGTDGNDNVYTSDANMTVKTADQVDWTGVGATSQVLQYFNEAGDTEVNVVVRDGVTLVRCTWTGDWPEPTGAVAYFVSMFAVKASGSIFDQRFASSEIESEDSSPWSPTDADPSAATSYANGNLRINIYETLGVVTSIVVEGYYDSRIYQDINESILFYPRLGPKYVST